MFQASVAVNGDERRKPLLSNAVISDTVVTTSPQHWHRTLLCHTQNSVRNSSIQQSPHWDLDSCQSMSELVHAGGKSVTGLWQSLNAKLVSPICRIPWGAAIHCLLQCPVVWRYPSANSTPGHSLALTSATPSHPFRDFLQRLKASSRAARRPWGPSTRASPRNWPICTTPRAACSRKVEGMWVRGLGLARDRPQKPRSGRRCHSQPLKGNTSGWRFPANRGHRQPLAVTDRFLF